jgi:hypothetical protein
MPIIPFMEFAGEGLEVAFRSSSEPQKVAIDVHTEGFGRHGLMCAAVSQLARFGSWGVVTGAEYEPGSGITEIIEQPAKEASNGPDYHWVLQVAGWSPRLIRVLVEQLRQTGSEKQVVTMRIRGELPLDSSPLSVRTEDVKRWLDDPDAYLEQWPEPGFLIEERTSKGGATIIVHQVEKPNAEQFEFYEGLIAVWKSWTTDYANIGGTGIGRTTPGALSKKSGRRMKSRVPGYDHRRKPVTNLLVNILAYYHRKTAELEKVEIELPASAPETRESVGRILREYLG